MKIVTEDEIIQTIVDDWKNSKLPQHKYSEKLGYSNAFISHIIHLRRKLPEGTAKKFGFKKVWVKIE